MRPRKVILCVGADEVRMSVRVFLLETRGFRVIVAATSVEEALGVLRGRAWVDLLLVDLPVIDWSEDVLLQAKKLRPGLHIVVTTDVVEYDSASGADAVLRKVSPAELIERVKILVVRKRGPHKKPVGSVGLERESERCA